MEKITAWGLMMFCTGICAGSAMLTAPQWHEEALRDGDVLLLSASSWRGALVQAADGADGLYAHAGLVGFIDGQAYLYHATPVEPGKVVAVPLMEFLRQQRVTAVRVLRPAASDVAAGDMALAYARLQAGRGVAFDREFDLDSSGALYCTELIWRAYLAAGIDLLASRTHPLRQAPLLGAVLWPADFNDMPELRPVPAFTRPMGV